MSTIRPNILPPQPQPRSGAGSDAGRLSAQRDFFALAAGLGQPAAVTAQPAGPQAVAAPAPRAAAALDPNQKIPRPGSLIDIRV